MKSSGNIFWSCQTTCRKRQAKPSKKLRSFPRFKTYVSKIDTVLKQWLQSFHDPHLSVPMELPSDLAVWHLSFDPLFLKTVLNIETSVSLLCPDLVGLYREQDFFTFAILIQTHTNTKAYIFYFCVCVCSLLCVFCFDLSCISVHTDGDFSYKSKRRRKINSW